METLIIIGFIFSFIAINVVCAFIAVATAKTKLSPLTKEFLLAIAESCALCAFMIPFISADLSYIGLILVTIGFFCVFPAILYPTKEEDK